MFTYHLYDGRHWSSFTIDEQFTSLAGSLIHLNASNNKLTSVPVLPAGLQYLNVKENKLDYDNGFESLHVPGISCMPTLPAALQNLYISTNNLTCLPNSVPRMVTDISLPICATGNPNGCPGVPVPGLNVTPNILRGITATEGLPSASFSYSLSGTKLLPATGNISTEQNAFLEFSTDNINFDANGISIPYTNGVLLSTTVYVRIAATVPAQTFTTHAYNWYDSLGFAAFIGVELQGVMNAPAGPLITAGPSITGLTATTGSPSTSAPYTLSAHGLLPASANITVTASANLELSTENVNFFTSALSIPYTGGSLSNTQVYVRIGSSAPQGTISGTVTNSGGGAANAIVTVNNNGKFIYSEIRSVYFGNDVNIVLVPNPAVDKVTVYLPGNKTMASINIYDINGRLIKQLSSNEEVVQINLVGLSKGVYAMRISGKGLNEVRKLMVE